MSSANRKFEMKSLCKAVYLKPLIMSLTGGAVLLAGCAGATDPSLSDTDVKNSAPSQTATIKPGAALGFTAKIDGELQVGAYSDVVIIISPGYNTGTLTAEATGTDGLTILASSTRLSHEVADGPAVWHVTVQPNDDGLHYLNIVATVSGLGSGERAARAFSFAIDPGAKSPPRKTANKAKVIQSGEQSLAIMDAEETIIPDE